MSRNYEGKDLFKRAWIFLLLVVVLALEDVEKCKTGEADFIKW